MKNNDMIFLKKIKSLINPLKEHHYIIHRADGEVIGITKKIKTLPQMIEENGCCDFLRIKSIKFLKHDFAYELNVEVLQDGKSYEEEYKISTVLKY